MTRQELLAAFRRSSYAVVATVSPEGLPQAALVGVAASERLELVFDTLGQSRKCANLRRTSNVACVIGFEGEITIQLEGVADEPQGDELVRLRRIYFDRFPDGPSRQGWPGITYVRVTPRWVRYSDFGRDPPLIVEFGAADLI